MLPVWFDTAKADAERRGLAHIVPVLEALRASGERLRQAPWADDAAARIALRGASLAPAGTTPPVPDAAAPPLMVSQGVDEAAVQLSVPEPLLVTVTV